MRAIKRIMNLLYSRKKRISTLTGLMLLGLVPGCTSTELQWMRDTTGVLAPPVSVSKGRMINVAKTLRPCQWGIASHPFIRALPSGRIVADFNVAGDGGDMGYAEISWPFFSEDGGETWIHGNPYADPGDPEFEKGIITLGSPTDIGPRVGLGGLARARLPSGMYVGHGYKATHTNAIGLWYRPDGLLGSREDVTIKMPVLSNHSREIRLQNASVDKRGTIYLTGYSSTPRGRRPGLESFLFVSHDGGSHYDYVSTIAAPEDVPDSTEGVSEPTIIVLPNNELFAVLRTGGHVPRVMLSARSKDQGKTWELADMEMVGVQPKLKLMSNGVLVLAAGRPGNHLYFSVDGGRNWVRQLALTEGGNSSGYVDIEEVSPGRLLALFDISNAPDPTIRFGSADKVCGIYAQHIDVTVRD